MRAINGAYTGTGADLDIKTPCAAPLYLRIINLTTGAIAEYNNCMPDGSIRTSDSGTDAVPLVGGITPIELQGFRIGNNAVANASGEKYAFTMFA